MTRAIVWTVAGGAVFLLAAVSSSIWVQGIGGLAAAVLIVPELRRWTAHTLRVLVTGREGTR